MSDLAGALCRGRWDLFDAVDPVSHREAAAICARCPALMACRTAAREILASGATVTHFGLQGTWGGELFGRVGHPRPLTKEPA